MVGLTVYVGVVGRAHSLVLSVKFPGVGAEEHMCFLGVRVGCPHLEIIAAQVKVTALNCCQWLREGGGLRVVKEGMKLVSNELLGEAVER